MSLPTLLKPESIVPQKWMTKEQKLKLKTQRSIDWIIEYLIDRSWDRKTPPKIKIKGPGSRVGIFRSGTGTGKSTVFPPYIFAEFYEKRGLKKNIICTQPTIATATDIPFQIAMYNANLKIGDTIGYQTGSLVRKPNKGVLFATIGILLQHLKILSDKDFMQKYSFIIIDEIHLRSVETDTTLFYLRRFLERNYEDPDCPFVILTSGTFEPEDLMNYFDCPKDAFLDIVGSTFPIQDNYTKFDVTDYMTYAVDLAEKIHVENVADITSSSSFRDILIFVQGGAQITEICDRIHKLNADVFSKGLDFSKKHSAEQQKKYGGGKTKPPAQEVYYLCPVAVTSENMTKGEREYQNTFSNIDSVSVDIYEFAGNDRTDKVIRTVPASRRVIVATNAIETGLTIDTLKYCIDTGYVNESQFNPNFGAVALMNKSVTQASVRQRRGRVGRKDPGVFYGCYTKDTYDAMVPLPYPDIIKADVTAAMLDAIVNETETKLVEVAINDMPRNKDGDFVLPPGAFQMNQFDQRWYHLTSQKKFDLSSLLFMQSPAADSFKYAFEKLRKLGFIDHEYKVTVFGWYASKFRKVEIENARMILAGYQHGANVVDLITIVCFLQAGHKLGIKWNKYKPRNPAGIPAAEVDLYYNMMIMDEFIEYLFIWNDYMEVLEDIATDIKKGDVSNPIDKVREWADENKLDADTLLAISYARDEMITDLLNLGMNPFYNGMGLPRGKYNLTKIISKNMFDGIDEIRKIKKCIYEGYRLNLHIWNDVTHSYMSHYNHNIVTLNSKLTKGVQGDDFKQNKPQKIIVAHTMIRQSQNAPGMYEFIGSDISVLDGYVEPDLDF